MRRSSTRTQEGLRWERICRRHADRHPWSQRGKEVEKPNVVWLCTYSQRSMQKHFPCPQLLQKIETVTAVWKQSTEWTDSKDSNCGLSPILPSKSDNTGWDGSEFFWQPWSNVSWVHHVKSNSAVIFFFLLEMVGFPGVPADQGLWRYRTEKPWSKQQNQLKARVQIPWNITGSQPYLRWASHPCSKDITHRVHSFATFFLFFSFFFLLFNLFL